MLCKYATQRWYTRIVNPAIHPLISPLIHRSSHPSTHPHRQPLVHTSMDPSIRPSVHPSIHPSTDKDCSQPHHTNALLNDSIYTHHAATPLHPPISLYLQNDASSLPDISQLIFSDDSSDEREPLCCTVADCFNCFRLSVANDFLCGLKHLWCGCTLIDCDDVWLVSKLLRVLTFPATFQYSSVTSRGRSLADLLGSKTSMRTQQCWNLVF